MEYLYYFWEWIIKNLDLLTKLATIGAAVFAAVSVLFLAKQIKIGIAQEKTNRSCELVKRYNDAVFGKMLIETMNTLRSEKKYKRLFELENPDLEAIKEKQMIGLSLNFFEEIGELYNLNHLDLKLTENYFAYVSSYYYDMAEDFIKFRIELTKRGKYMEQWRIMKKTFENKGLYSKDDVVLERRVDNKE